MNLFRWLSRWINERGSAAIMRDRLALKDDEIEKLKAEKRDLKIAHEQEQYERDTVQFHNGIEFRRGLKTSGRWMAFCPKCHLPAQDVWLGTVGGNGVACSGNCGWQVFTKLKLSDLIQSIES